MDLSIPDDKFAQLNQQALAAGYSDVSAFIDAIIDEPSDDPRGSLTEETLKKSAEDCDSAIAELKKGGGRDFRQAMQEIGRRRGFPTVE